MKKILFFCIIFFAVCLFLGKELSPFDPHLFTVHDNTQAARIQEFALNLTSGIIPPRLAPNFSFRNGFPVFNFYAPFAYWVGAFFHIGGVSSAISLKLVFFLGLVVSFVTFFLFSSLFFGFFGGIFGAVLYSSSLWMAVEIFVRGNIGEIWFMALFPLGLYFLKRYDTENKSWLFFLSAVTLSFIFTVHNVLSLVSIPFVIIFSCGLIHKKRIFLILLFALLLGSYFLIPAILENKLTYATEIATKTKYSDHFLCVWQLWKANKWSFGGSGIGCINDDMSFQIGKIHLILASIGAGIFFILFAKEKKKKGYFIPIFILSWTLFSAFLTLYVSQPIWDVLSPIMASFQYPWRFLPFVTFGVAYFASYTSSIIKNKRIHIPVIVLLSLCILYSSSKFFSKPWKYTTNEYTALFLTKKYVEQKAAYEIPEYFPRTGNYDIWRLYDKSEKGFPENPLTYKINSSFYKEITADKEQITLPIHYFPFWEIRINEKLFVPKYFDALGRPILSHLSLQSSIVLKYNETPIEKSGNIMSFIAFGLLLFICLNKKIWKKINTILK